MKRSLDIIAGLGLSFAIGAVVISHSAYACPADGVSVSAVWNGLPGVSGGCIGGNGVNPIYELLSIIIGFITGVLGLVMVIMIIIAGLQYVVSAGSPDTIKAAKDRIRNVMTGFVLFVLMWGILQVILPPQASIFK